MIKLYLHLFSREPVMNDDSQKSANNLLPKSCKALAVHSTEAEAALLLQPTQAPQKNRTPQNIFSHIKANAKTSGLNWKAIIFLVLTPLLSLIFVPVYFYSHPLSLSLVITFIVLFSLTNLSITVGYHRYFAHRSYEAHPILQLLLLFFGTGAFQGTVLQWATDHRRHHFKVDSDDDPYSINKGFWYAHIGWMFLNDKPQYLGNYAVDLQKNKILQFQHKHYAILASLIGFILPGFLGQAMGFGFWGGFIILGLLRIVLTQHSTFFINSLCHYLGRRPYSDQISARDSIIMAFLTFGEGYHNYHHKFQIDYRNGIRWYHWDPTKWSIKTFSYMKLATKLRTVSENEILKARIIMDEKIILARGARHETVVALKLKLEVAQTRLKAVREEYARLKANVQLHSREAFLHLKAELELAKIEFRNAYEQWLVYVKNYSRMPQPN